MGYGYDDFETSGDALEYYDQQRLEADMEQYEMYQTALELEQMRANGECPHSSGIGYVRPAVYPEAAHLKPGEFLCTDICKQTIPDPYADWR